MRFRLVAPLRRKGTSNSWFMKRIPVDVRERMAGLSLVVPIGSEVVRYSITPKTTTIRFSLRTSDPSEVKARQADAAAYFERLWASLRTSTPITLTHRQCVALSKDIFQAWVGEGGRTLVAELAADRSEWTIRGEPFTPPEEWGAALDALPALEGDAEPEKLEATFGPIVDHSLRERGIAGVDEASRAMILREFVRALRDAFTVQKRQASGDYSPAPEQSRFPEWDAPKPTLAADVKKGTETASKSKVSLRGLVAKWWAEAEKANRSRSTHDNYNRTVKAFAAFLKHDDATRVTREDVVRFKDARVPGGAKLKTVADGDLVALKVVLGWAMIMASSPPTLQPASRS